MKKTFFVKTIWGDSEKASKSIQSFFKIGVITRAYHHFSELSWDRTKFETFCLKKNSQYVNRYANSIASGLAKISPVCVKIFLEEEENGRDGQDTEEASKDNGYNPSGWASIEFSHPNEDRGYDSHCRGTG